MRNNVTRLLNARKVDYRLLQLPTDEKRSALESARLLGLPPHQVFKTLVALPKKGGKAVLGVIPGPDQLDLKALATALGEKKVSLATQRQAEELTGLQAGGISALALTHKPFRVVLDRSALDLPAIVVSAGQRGLNLSLSASDFLAVTGGFTAPISRTRFQHENPHL